MPHSEMRLPADKFDTEAVRSLAGLSYSQIEPILPKLLEWLQDLNWPVAKQIGPILTMIGSPLALHLKSVLASNDAIWKYGVLSSVVAESGVIATCLRPELTRLAELPTDEEKAEGVDEVARIILRDMPANDPA